MGLECAPEDQAFRDLADLSYYLKSWARLMTAFTVFWSITNEGERLTEADVRMIPSPEPAPHSGVDRPWLRCSKR